MAGGGSEAFIWQIIANYCMQIRLFDSYHCQVTNVTASVILPYSSARSLVILPYSSARSSVILPYSSAHTDQELSNLQAEKRKVVSSDS